ncbi:CPBP family intramembrane glutamic endopeptidase [Tenacibaculum sp. L6]|uniref:CPBP family intramembrane glutamic endopeptidase n=1 Tax=Tenacibaculum sp. L6 TaxID=2992764 RepID=UPI00237BCDFB|nr:CPBP family intramembrane glutamic endopeptidase [Tenacibaculum sp. L6]MDE0534987.1 CPBP family intramembrane metalloprotease [Tenacibaculum sp. L6]
MKETFYELIAYLKNPVLEKDANQNASYRFQKFLHLLTISIVTGALLSPLFVLIEELGWVNMDDHAMEELLKTHSKWFIAGIAVILAPLLEEIFFRAPITLFQSKKSFKIAFYVFAILFGLVHLTNFNITTNVLLLAPILVAPQTILGGYLGFIRVRFGLAWSILLHACYNAFFVLLSFAGDLM